MRTAVKSHSIRRIDTRTYFVNNEFVIYREERRKKRKPIQHVFERDDDGFFVADNALFGKQNR